MTVITSVKNGDYLTVVQKLEDAQEELNTLEENLKQARINHSNQI